MSLLALDSVETAASLARRLDAELRRAHPKAIIAKALEIFGDELALVSSFGAESAVLLHMASEVSRNIPVLFLDTGMLFGQTLDYRQQLAAKLGLTDVRDLRPRFEDLAVGMSERLSKTVASSDVVGFAQLTGDRNPIHLSEHFAAKTSFGRRIAHGLYTASLISAVLGTRLPGPGAVYISQTLNFRAPVKIGDTVEVP